jgi:hypothetical protein
MDNKQERKFLSVALLSADLAWKLLTLEQQRQSLEYIKKVCKEKEEPDEDTQEVRATR